MGGKPSFETGKGATFAAAVFFVFEIVAATASAEAAAEAASPQSRNTKLPR